MTLENGSKRGGARPGAGRPKSEHKKRQISVHISEDIAERLDSIAKERKMPRSQVIEALLAVYVFDDVGFEAVVRYLAAKIRWRDGILLGSSDEGDPTFSGERGLKSGKTSD